MNTKCYTTEIQPTMKDTIQWLQDLGYHTTDSGDGILNVEAGMEGALDYPHVFIRLPQECDSIRRAHQLFEQCVGVGLNPEEITVELNYSPQDRSAILYLLEVTDEILHRSPGWKPLA